MWGTAIAMKNGGMKLAIEQKLSPDIVVVIPDADAKLVKPIMQFTWSATGRAFLSRSEVGKCQGFMCSLSAQFIIPAIVGMLHIITAIGYLALSLLITWTHTIRLNITYFLSKVGKKKQIQNIHQKFQTRTKSSRNQPRSRQSSTSC